MADKVTEWGYAQLSREERGKGSYLREHTEKGRDRFTGTIVQIQVAEREQARQHRQSQNKPENKKEPED